jgi:glycosyltransferase involved in cell wall biosynthesis
MRTVALMLESDGPGGAERVLMELADELRRRGREVVPVGPSDGCGWLAGEFRSRGYVPEQFHLRSPLDPFCVTGLVGMLRRRNVDVVHSHEFTMAFYGAAAARVLRLPHVITMHGGMGFATRARRRIAMRWACRNSRSVVAVSEPTRAALSGALRLPAETIRVVPNGLRFGMGERGRVRAELRLADDEALILAVGNLYPVKGHIVLLRAMAALERSGVSRWRLVIAGRGEEEAALRRFADENGFADRLHLLGYRSDIHDLLAACDIFAMPSLSEGLPMALLEAMFAARPIIVSAVGGIPDVITPDEHGILVEPGNHADLSRGIDRLLKASAENQRMGSAARQRAESDYGVETMVDRYEALYRWEPTGRTRDRHQILEASG